MTNKRLSPFLLILITAIEGLVALAVYLTRVTPLTITRAAIGGLAGLAEAGLLAVILAANVRPVWAARCSNRAANRLERDQYLTRMIVALGFLAVLTAGLAGLFTSPAAYNYDFYARLFPDIKGVKWFESARSLAATAMPLLIWLALALVQAAAGLWLAFHHATHWDWREAGITLLALALTTVAIGHWLILGYKVQLLANIPGWYWSVGDHVITGSWWIFAGLAGLCAAVIVLVLRKPGRVWLNLLMLVALGYALQVGFGFLDGRGYEYVRLKYAGTLHRSYAMRAAASTADPLRAIRDYEELYGEAMFPSTKPPGVMVFYILTGKLVNALQPQESVQARFEALTSFAAVIFPLISFLVVIIIYRLARAYLDERSAYFPAVLYLFAPNILLLPLFLDQVLYPLLFSGGMLLTVRAAQSGGFWAGVALGAGLYLAAFFSFSLLPLIPFSVLYIGLNALLRRKERPVRAQWRVAAGMAGGAVALFLIFWLVFDYDVVTRFQNAMAVVHYYDYFERGGAAETGVYTRAFSPNLNERLGAMWLNNLDFGAGTGFPLYLLFLAGGVRSLVSLVRGKIQRGELLLAVIFLTFAAMNLYGQNRGESARLWMFWVPGVVLLAGGEVVRLFRRKDLALGALVLAQLVTVLLTFQFQDFWM